MTADNQPLQLIKICGPTEAEMIQEMLENNGISSSLQGEVAAITLPATGELTEVRIFVNPPDAERASELVKGFFTPVEKGEVVEPAAGLWENAKKEENL